MEREHWGEGCSKTPSSQGLTLPVALGGEWAWGTSCTQALAKCWDWVLSTDPGRWLADVSEAARPLQSPPRDPPRSTSHRGSGLLQSQQETALPQCTETECYITWCMGAKSYHLSYALLPRSKFPDSMRTQGEAIIQQCESRGVNSEPCLPQAASGLSYT